MRRVIEVLIPWLHDRREARAALEEAQAATVEAAERKGRTDQVVRSIHRRVYTENHITEAVVHLLQSRRSS